MSGQSQLSFVFAGSFDSLTGHSPLQDSGGPSGTNTAVVEISGLVGLQIVCEYSQILLSNIVEVVILARF